MDESSKLRIVHCFRSPVGGIFRHVRDLVESQNANGHDVGILCDSTTGGAHEEKLFEVLRPSLNLGLHRIPMRRAITPGDLLVLYKAYQKLKKLNPDILHAHGSKGGAYARIIGAFMRRSSNRPARLYCPHGGSIHYDSASLKGKLFFFLERSLEFITDRLIFVSKYERDGYAGKVGVPRCPTSLVYNGLQDDEFDAVGEHVDAADFLYIGMMRDLKGPDLFIDAFAALANKTNKMLTAHMVGDGPDKEKYVRQVADLNLSEAITFHDAMPARTAFAMARTVIVPSRAESMPYIVLEAIAAQKPIIASRVGGIPEIFAEEPDLLVEPDNAKALETAMANSLDDPKLINLARARAKTLKNRFSVEVMARDVEAAYLAG
ncbi:MAG: glycosyltransferase family 4 protein [Hyphomicrobiales bacterium]|nr:glycosyltransferase family 4 protein [Hyphomicrobiales bacterium]